MSAKASEVRQELEEAFASRAAWQNRMDLHPIVVRSLSEGSALWYSS